MRGAGLVFVMVSCVLPSWAQADRPLLFTAPAGAGAIHLYTARADGSSPRVLTPHQGVDAHPTWTPGGALIVFVSDRSGHSDLYLTDPSGLDLRPMNVFAPSGNAKLAAPDVSPDGSQVAYHVEDQSAADVWTARIDGSHAVNLTRGQGHSRYPDWSPDGKTIYFESEQEGEMALYRMHADGSHAERLTSGERPAVSPNGARVAYSFQGALWVCDSDGHDPRVLVGLGEQPAWSPDGSRLVFVVRQGLGTHLYTSAADGSNQRLIPLPYEGVRQPAW